MEIGITRHAMDAYQRRLRTSGSWSQLEQEIRARVRRGLEANQISDRKIKAFRRYREKVSKLLPNERFVWDEDAGWIVRFENHRCVVITTVMRTKATA